MPRTTQYMATRGRGQRTRRPNLNRALVAYARLALGDTESRASSVGDGRSLEWGWGRDHMPSSPTSKACMTIVRIGKTNKYRTQDVPAGGKETRMLSFRQECRKPLFHATLQPQLAGQHPRGAPSGTICGNGEAPRHATMGPKRCARTAAELAKQRHGNAPCATTPPACGWKSTTRSSPAGSMT